MSATRTDDGGFAIDPAELFRAFQPERPSEHVRGTGRNGLDGIGRNGLQHLKRPTEMTFWR